MHPFATNKSPHAAMSRTPTDEEEGNVKYDEKITVADVGEELTIEDIDYSEEKRILRKIDWNLIPVFGVSCVNNCCISLYRSDLHVRPYT